ncbi:SRPBCC family protein, partial [Arthrospira platensis SPKY1]|nr:SRPBCC family protein [Arthrospira platensis SPKY1]
PLIRKATVVQRSARGYETEQVLAVGLLVHRFRTRTELDPPRSIIVTAADEAFQPFIIRWSFTPTPEGHCRVDFALDCAVHWFWLQPLGGALTARIATTTVHSFVARAEAQEQEAAERALVPS